MGFGPRTQIAVITALGVLSSVACSSEHGDGDGQGEEEGTGGTGASAGGARTEPGGGTASGGKSGSSGGASAGGKGGGSTTAGGASSAGGHAGSGGSGNGGANAGGTNTGGSNAGGAQSGGAASSGGASSGGATGSGGSGGGNCHAPGTIVVNHNGASDYTFDGVADPTLTLCRGNTYTFELHVSGHPFYIKTVQGAGTGNAYNTGVTNNGAETGDVTFAVPQDGPSPLYYNCAYHSSMTGKIDVVN